MSRTRNAASLPHTGGAFEFVYERPNVHKNGKIAKQVRSHVSRRQHQQNREKRKRDLALVLSETSTPEPVSIHSGSIEHAEETRASVESRSSSSAIVWRAAPSWQKEDLGVLPQFAFRTYPADQETGETLVDDWLCPSSGLVRAYSRGEMDFRIIALRDTENVVGRSLKRLELDLSSVMSLYNSIVKVQSADVREQGGSLKSTKPYFFEFVHTDPTLLSMAILLGARNHLNLSGRDKHGYDSTGIYNLEKHVVCGINDALSDGVRSVSRQMLAAVVLCAAYELKHGDPRRFHVHMNGLMTMIGLRGGLPGIAACDPYMLKFLLWMDANTASLAGTERYLSTTGAGCGYVKHPNPNPKVFRARHERDCDTGSRHANGQRRMSLT